MRSSGTSADRQRCLSTYPCSEEDLLGIGRYTLERWGEVQCRRYLTELDARFHALAKSPEAGRTCDEIRAGYRCYREGKHVIFYRLGRTQ